jgi:threonine dehydratase
MQVFGVEPETGNDVFLSLRKGQRVSISPPPTIADGVRTTAPGALTFPILQRNLSDVLLVSEEEILAGVRALAFGARLVVEPTGAVGAAAVLAGKLPLPAGSRVGVVLSGGNVDRDLLIQILGA